jgi:transcriptional regulator with XRE-family HTH domain
VSTPTPSPIAARIRAYIARRQETEPTYSGRALSVASGLGPSQLGATLGRLEKGGSVRADLLEAIAAAMGITPGELLGEAPPVAIVPPFAALPGWAAAVADAASRYMMRPEGLRAIGQWRPDAIPRRMDAAFVASLYRAWEDLQGA